MAQQVIVIGGGLAGLSAAHTIIENGGNVVVIDKMPFFGGNSTKATSGINGAGTRSQRALNIPDTPEIFEDDTSKSAKEGLQAGLVKVLTHQSGAAVEWLMDSFDLDLSLVSRLGGHSQPRTHRGAERFPGMTITMALVGKLEELAENEPEVAQIIIKAEVTKFVTDADGAVMGVEYTKDGQSSTMMGPVVIATGGFGADFSADSLLNSVSQDWRTLSAWKTVNNLPNLMDLPTTNGDHCTGDGIKMALAVGADTIDMEAVQVHPTGMVHPEEPTAKVKFLAAEALRGVGGVLLNAKGERFCNDLGKRDYVSGCMWNDHPPFRLVLNSAASKEIAWHCKHYKGRGLMKGYATGADLAKDIGIPVEKLEAEFQRYNGYAKNGNDPWGKQYFNNLPLTTKDSFHVAVVTPVVHYTMGGLDMTPDAEVKNKNGPIKGLFCAGEVMGGVHGKNRLGGNSLLDCVAFGRVAGRSVAKYLLRQNMMGAAQNRMGAIAGHLAPISIEIDPVTNRLNISVAMGDGAGVNAGAIEAAPTVEASAPSAAAASSSTSASTSPMPDGNVALVYGSFFMGDCERDIKTIHETFPSIDGLKCIDPMQGNDFDFNALKDCKLLVVCVSSQYGLPPPNFKRFAHQLLIAAESNPGCLKHLQHTVYGNGDDTYYKTYMNNPRYMDMLLEKCGSRRFYARGETGEPHAQMDADACRCSAWAPAMWDAAKTADLSAPAVPWDHLWSKAEPHTHKDVTQWDEAKLIKKLGELDVPRSMFAR